MMNRNSLAFVGICLFMSGCLPPASGLELDSATGPEPYVRNSFFETPPFYSVDSGARLHQPVLNMEFRVLSESFPESLNVHLRSGAEEAMTTFNLNPSNLKINMTYVAQESEINISGNGFNEIYVSRLENPELQRDVAARAFLHVDSEGVIRECDIQINPDSLFLNYAIHADSLISGEIASIGAVVAHEIGHCAGLSHRSDTMDIMGDPVKHLYINSDLSYAFLGPAASDALVQLYGFDGAQGDLSVDNIKFDPEITEGLEVEYAQTQPTKITTIAGERLHCTDEAGSSRSIYYEGISPGHAYNVEFTFQNIGFPAETQLSVALEFVLAKSSDLQEGSRTLGTGEIFFDKSFATIVQVQQVSIPSDIDLYDETWYLGVKLDPENRFAERIDFGDQRNNNLGTYCLRINPFKRTEKSILPSDEHFGNTTDDILIYKIDE